MKLESLSASRIKTFDQCQLKYHSIYELGMKEEEVHPLTLMGSAVHRMLERAILAAKSKGIVVGEGSSDPFTYKAEACREFSVPVEHWNTIDDLVRNALTWGYFRAVDSCYDCELKCQFHLPDGTPVNGIIDRLDLFKDWADVIDIKTQKDAFEPQELQDNWQARIYNIAVRIDHPEVAGKVSISFWVLRHQVQRVWLTEQDAENDILRLSEKAASIRACISPKASPSGLCRWCPNCENCSLSKSNIKTRMANKMKVMVTG